MKSEELKERWHELKDKARNYWHSFEKPEELGGGPEAMHAKEHEEPGHMFDDFVSSEEELHKKEHKKPEHHIDDIAGSE